MNLKPLAYGFLCFMRGMYPADLNSLSSHNLDYNFAKKIAYEQKGSSTEVAL